MSRAWRFFLFSVAIGLGGYTYGTPGVQSWASILFGVVAMAYVIASEERTP